MAVIEGSTSIISGRILDESAAGVSSDSLLTFTLTLYDYVTGAIINGRNAVSMLNVNGGTVSNSPGSEGNFQISLTPEDNAILDQARQSEVHVALIRFTTPVSTGSNEIRFTVRNSKKIT